MKTKNLLAMAIAGLALCACSNDNEAVIPENEKANIVVDFSGIRTRAIEDPVGDGEYAPVGDVQLFILAGNSVLVYDKLTAEDLTALNGSNHKVLKEYTGVSASATTVYAVANAEDYKRADSPFATFTAFKDHKYTKDGQNATSEAQDVLLSGSVALTAGVVDEGVTTYEVDLTLTPEVARFQVEKVEVKTGSKITDFKIGGIYLNMAYDKMNLNFVGSDAFETEEKANLTYYDALGAFAITTGFEAGKIPADECAAFNFFASATSDLAPHILIKITDIAYAEDFSGDDTSWITITSFNEGANEFTDWKKGDIYTIETIQFDENSVGPNPYDKNVNVKATIKVAPWSEVALIPNL